MGRFFKKNWKEILSVFAIIMGVFIFFSDQVCDSDFWWQIKYAQYMLANHTFIPDHTLYSWFPSDNKTIYCAWVAQMAMYLLYSAGALPAVFLLRYAIFAVVGFSLYQYSRGFKSLNKGAVVACITSMFWLLSPSTAVRPTLFSILCFALFVWIYATVKRDSSRYRLFYLFPVVMVLWVNSHGLFIFGGVFLFIGFIGDLLNCRFGSSNILDKRALMHLFSASVLTGFAFMATPYGWTYLINLQTEIFGNAAYMKFQSEVVSEFKSFYAANEVLFAVSIIWSILALILFFRAWRRKKLDISYLILMVAFLGMGLYYYRLALFFAVIAGFISIDLVAATCEDILSNIWAKLAVAGYSAVFLFLYFGNSIYYPYLRGDLFNVDVRTQCAVEEAEFVKKCGFKKIGNDANIGSYLLWALGPDAKIMMDPRWFPYKEKLPEFIATTYADPLKFLDFAFKQDCDAWIFSYTYTKQIASLFYGITDWKVGFYGQFGIVYVHADYPAVPSGRRIGNFRDIHNIVSAGTVMMIACDLNDWVGAEEALYSIDHNFDSQKLKQNIIYYHAYYEGRRALFEKDYKKATELLGTCDTNLARALFIFSSQMYALDLWSKGDEKSAYLVAVHSLEVKADDSINLYNAGVSGWWVNRQLKEGKIKDVVINEKWRENLTSFLKGEEGNAGTAQVQQVCRQILDGTYNQKPILLYPEMPMVLSKVRVDK